jgi:sugar fermentation stimulation protein A
MHFPSPLLRGRLVKRYKRFLADVVLDTGETVTATCPNTGSMKGLTEPGSIVWLSTSDSATRKYKHTWEMIENDIGAGPVLVGINTGHPNKILTEAIEAGKIAPLAGYGSLKREQKYGKNSRIDILLQDEAKPTCYVEIKNVHLMRKAGLAEFPDSVTERGAKHLGELADMVREGKRAVMAFLVQRGDAKRVSLARDIDTAYGIAFDEAIAAGVEAIAVRCRLSETEINVDGLVDIAEASTRR